MIVGVFYKQTKVLKWIKALAQIAKSNMNNVYLD